jgi:DNA helicase HerA-like ATPase
VRPFALGRWVGLDGAGAPQALHLPPHHLVTHAAVVGMTGSGKTGLVFVLVEEALRSGVPVVMIDLKGDLPNLLLAFPLAAPAAFEPWIDASAPQHQGTAGPRGHRQRARPGARRRAARSGPGAPPRWRLPTPAASVRVLTPGSTAGEPVHLLSSLERRSPLWDTDLESARAACRARCRWCSAWWAGTRTPPGRRTTCCSRCWPSAGCARGRPRTWRR